MTNTTDDGRNLLLRGDNYTNDHNDKYGALHNYLNFKEVEAGRRPYIQYGYTKKTTDYTDPKRGKSIVWSNPGPFMHTDPDNNASAIFNNVTRHTHTKIKTTENTKNINPETGESIGMNQYVVVGLRRPNKKSKKTKDKTYKPHEDFMGRVKKFRNWDQGVAVDATDATADEHHDESGFGHITIHRPDGRKIRYHYQDYQAITPAHDNRAADDEIGGGNTKTPEGKHVGLAIVSSAVSSTPNDELKHSTLLHNPKNLDANGILHANHPAQQEQAIANASDEEKQKLKLYKFVV